MSWDDPDERRKRFRKWFGEFLPEDMLRQIEQMMEQMLRDFDGRMLDPSKIEEMMKDAEGVRPFMFGFSMTMGPDGTPIVQRFGNTTPGEKGPSIGPMLEPLVDVIEEGDDIVVVAELPGVEKDEIKIKVKGRTMTIHVDNPERPYHKEIDLPSAVKKGEGKSSIRNGVLEVRLKKA